MLIKRFFRLIGSILLFVAAIIGFLLPIIPGSVFLLLGLLLFSPTHGKKIFNKIKKLANKLLKRSN